MGYSTVRMKSDRPRAERDFYPTPHELCRVAIAEFLKDENNPDLYTSLDAGAGNGVWGKYYRMWKDRDVLFGVEIDDVERPKWYDFWIKQDYLEFEPEYDKFELIFGNPPYSLAEEFIRHSMTLLGEDGYVYFLLRLAFLESKKRHFGLFTEYPPKRVYVLSRRPSFFSTKTNSKTTDTLAYAMFLWQNGWHGKTELEWLWWTYDE